MEPFHRRLATIFLEADGELKNMSNRQRQELMESLKAHTHWALKLDKLEKLADLSHRLGNEPLEREVCEKIDQHLQNTLA